MDAYPAVSARLYLVDRAVKLIDEGIDIALCIAHLPDRHPSRSGSAKCAAWSWRRLVIWRGIRELNDRATLPGTKLSR